MNTRMSISANFNGREPEVLTFSALLTLLGRRSRQSIYDLMRRDPSFPRPRQIGSEFSIGWLRGEVMEWLNSRPQAELNGLDAVERRRRARGAKGEGCVAKAPIGPPRA
jgi:predicted DNA-binding transcriptional regulator AlpA